MVNVTNEHADKTSVIVHSDNYTNNECPIHRVFSHHPAGVFSQGQAVGQSDQQA